MIMITPLGCHSQLAHFQVLIVNYPSYPPGPVGEVARGEPEAVEAARVEGARNRRSQGPAGASRLGNVPARGRKRRLD